MTELIIAAVVGLVLGICGTIGIQQAGKPQKQDEPIIVKDKTAEKQQEIIKQLTNLDLIFKICNKDYIDTYGDGLCRELSCLQFSRGIDSKTNHCEPIANINNTRTIIDSCLRQDEGNKDSCIDLFLRRK